MKLTKRPSAKASEPTESVAPIRSFGGSTRPKKCMELIMSTSLGAPIEAHGVAWPFLSRSLRARLDRWLAAYSTWRIEQRAAERLFAMSDRQLKDIGLTRSGIMGALREAADNQHPSPFR
jgi:uncharacterized protein YjiS (DUF1127 family)